LGFEVIVNRNLLNQILVEEGMDPERAQRISIRFLESRERTRKQKLFDFLLFGDSAGGYWIEDQETAVVFTNQLRSSERVSEVLAHELGHAIDKAKSSYFWPVIRAWVGYLALLTGGTAWHFGRWIEIWEKSPDLRLVVIGAILATAVWIFLILSVTTCIWWPLLQILFYRDSRIEKSARNWEKRLIARPDWRKVLTVKEER